MIIYDQQNSRMLDTENGDYMLAQPAESHPRVWYFNLYDSPDQPLLASIVEIQNIDEHGNSGRTTLSRCLLRQAWIPTGHPEPPRYFAEYHPQIPRLAAFLEAQLYARSNQHPPPRFEFIDERGTVASPASTSGTHQSTGKGILLGLLLTLGLHLIQLLLVMQLMRIAPVRNDMRIFYFGFTQVLYMLPAIYYAWRKGHLGVMKGLIIGASLTFLLGLPIAGLAYICGHMVSL